TRSGPGAYTAGPMASGSLGGRNMSGWCAAALAGTLVALSAGCAPGSTNADGPGATLAQPVPVEVHSDADLYAVPDPLPAGRQGALLRYQRIDGLIAGATAYRIMYLSESLQGRPIVVTGQAVVPDTPPPNGGRVVLANAHGTTGSADACAPSKIPTT